MARGLGGVPPQKQKRERVAHISNPATSGAQNAGKPSAHGGGKTGRPGGETRMVWGVAPQRNQKREAVATLPTLP